MKTAFLLFFQLGMSVVLLGLNPSPFGLIQENPQGVFAFWRESLELFSIPFCLLLLSFSKKPLFIFSKGTWGVWTAFSSFWVLGMSPGLHSQVPFAGILFLSFFGILGFSLALQSGFEWIARNPSASRQSLSFGKNKSLEASSVSNSQPLPKVEGV